MKKIVCLFLLLVLSMTVTAFAVEDHYVYTDETSGMTLEIPSDWKVSYEDDYVSFAPISGKSVAMEYYCEDAFEELSESEKKGLDREDINNDLYSKADIADIFEVKSKNVKIVNLGGTEYFQVKVQETSGFLFFKTTKTITYLVYFEDGWMHLYKFGDDTDNDLYGQFEALIATANYHPEEIAEEPDVEEEKEDDESTLQISLPTIVPMRTDADIYEEAEEAYYDRDYATAYELFDSIEDYEDSDKYLRLLRIRMCCFNCGMGADVYCKEMGLTSSVKRDIDAAAKDFYFADTADVLVCNSDVACYYLLGRWEGGSKCYWQINEDAIGGYNYYIGSKLSTNYQSTFSIYEGVVTVDVLGSCATVMTITLTAPDCMEVVSCEKGGCYTLNRN